MRPEPAHEEKTRLLEGEDAEGDEGEEVEVRRIAEALRAIRQGVGLLARGGVVQGRITSGCDGSLARLCHPQRQKERRRCWRQELFHLDAP